METARSESEIYDVAVVGAGPVGLLMALFMAQAGHSVVLLERQQSPYHLPRAVHFDDEIARVLAGVGLGPELGALTVKADSYEWRNAAGETLLHFDWSGTGRSGWPIANMFHQPTLEVLLARHVEDHPNVVVRRGEDVLDVEEGSEAVLLRTKTGETEGVARARYVVGCDGARSFIRERIGTTVTDLGFAFDWLVVDLLTDTDDHEGPANLQVCDPVRPTTSVSGGPGRRRFEFLRLPDESLEDLEREDTVWRLLAPWGLNSENATLERHVVYAFRAAWAQSWRQGRLLIAGDAAHLMPPFAGQGMCSGMRDVANLSWKLDFVLRGLAPDGLLDTYTSERSAHVQNAIGQSVALGNVICVTDPGAVAERDSVMLAGGGDPEKVLPPIPVPVLGEGFVHRRSDGSVDPYAGRLAIQPRVSGSNGSVGLWDQIVGTGFSVVTSDDLTVELGEERLAELKRFGVRVVRVLSKPDGARPDCVVDVDGTLLPHLAEMHHDVIVVRPDHYLFGTTHRENAVALVDDLLGQISGADVLEHRP